MPAALRPRLVSVAEAASYLGLSRTRIYQLADERKLSSRWEGTRRLITVESLDAYADQMPDERPT